ncbi:hypothetical protein [Cryobacterium sp. Y11]|uniref:hypothetical protein n=1 Tax=Cryobacterium sp. Y11 TaxID=2045016 RepID=UPI0011B00E92|nr:hypothetical protein [Cryobacterium sp. Y11]
MTTFATAVLCIDAARVITSTEVNQRLSVAVELMRIRKDRLALADRSLPSDIWLKRTGQWSVAVLLLLPSAAQLLTDPGYFLAEQSRSTLPEFWLIVVSVLGTALAGVVLLLLEFGLALIFLLIVNLKPLTRGQRLGIVSAATILVAVLVVRPGWADVPIAASTLYLVNTCVIFSATFITWYRLARQEAPRHPKLTFGIHGLLLLALLRIFQKLVRTSEADVDWLISEANPTAAKDIRVLETQRVVPPRARARSWFSPHPRRRPPAKPPVSSERPAV